jgi:hypothetical protein
MQFPASGPSTLHAAFGPAEPAFLKECYVNLAPTVDCPDFLYAAPTIFHVCGFH